MPQRNQNPTRGTIIDLLRHYEPDRYAAALLAPSVVRDDLLNIAAFAAQITKLRLEVSELALAQIRLQWWRDAMCNARSAKSSGHPVAQALSATITRHDIAPDLVDECLVAAERAMAGGVDRHDPGGLVSGAEGVVQFARAESILFQIATDILSNPADAERSGAPLIAACTHAGGAYGGARLVFEQSRKAQYQQTVEDDQRMQNLIGTARNEARLAKAARRAINPALAPALHPLALVEPYLRWSEHRSERSRRAQFATLPLYRMWRIGRAHLGKVY